jgi:hypothetical protein
MKWRSGAPNFKQLAQEVWSLRLEIQLCPSVTHNCAEPTLAELSLVGQLFVKNCNSEFYENSGNYLVAGTRLQTTDGRDLHTRTPESEWILKLKGNCGNLFEVFTVVWISNDLCRVSRCSLVPVFSFISRNTALFTCVLSTIQYQSSALLCK